MTTNINMQKKTASKIVKIIIALSGMALLAIFCVFAVSYSNRTYTLGDIQMIDPAIINKIHVYNSANAGSGIDNYDITDPEKIREIVEHINAFTYTSSYYLDVSDRMGTTTSLTLICYREEFKIEFGWQCTAIAINNVWYKNDKEGDEYFIKLFKMLPPVTSSVWGDR